MSDETRATDVIGVADRVNKLAWVCVRAMDCEGEIKILDLYTLETTARYKIRTAQRTSEALVEAGYIGNSPITPSVAISIKTLELFRSLRLFKASFSVEAFAKLICHYYYVTIIILHTCVAC